MLPHFQVSELIANAALSQLPRDDFSSQLCNFAPRYCDNQIALKSTVCSALDTNSTATRSAPYALFLIQLISEEFVASHSFTLIFRRSDQVDIGNPMWSDARRWNRGYPIYHPSNGASFLALSKLHPPDWTIEQTKLMSGMATPLHTVLEVSYEILLQCPRGPSRFWNFWRDIRTS